MDSLFFAATLPEPLKDESLPMISVHNTDELHQPVFDYDDFLERMDGDRELLREVIEIFLEDAPAQLSALQDACRLADPAAMEKAAHTLKGAAANISAKALQQLSGTMQELIRKGQAAQAERLMNDMESQYGKLDRMLRACLADEK